MVARGKHDAIFFKYQGERQVETHKHNKMKTLQSFKNLAISNFEKQYICGGAASQGSGTILGSAYSYNGEVNQTASHQASIAIVSETHYTTDFCGTISVDGGSGPACAHLSKGIWVIDGMK